MKGTFLEAVATTLFQPIDINATLTKRKIHES